MLMMHVRRIFDRLKKEKFCPQLYLFLVRNFNLLYTRVVATAVTITPRMNPPNNDPSVTPMLVSVGNTSKTCTCALIKKKY